MPRIEESKIVQQIRHVQYETFYLCLWCACKCVFMHILTPVLMCIYTLRLMVDIGCLLDHSILYELCQGLLLKPELAHSQSCQQACLRMNPFPPLTAENTGGSYTCVGVYISASILNSSSHTQTASMLSTEPLYPL